MIWLALVNQLLHGQQPNLTDVLQRQANCVRRLVCGSSETLKFGIKRHYSHQIKLKLALILEAD